MKAPYSRMDIITSAEFKKVMKESLLAERYNEDIDRESAYEKLTRKLEKAAKDQEIEVTKTRTRSRSRKKDPSFFETAGKNTMVRQLGRTLVRELSRGLLGVLGLKPTRRRR